MYVSELILVPTKFIPLSTVVTAEFEPCSYSVNESSPNVSVCVRVSGQRARNHVVRVQTRDITATGITITCMPLFLQTVINYHTISVQLQLTMKPSMSV